MKGIKDRGKENAPVAETNVRWVFFFGTDRLYREKNKQNQNLAILPV